MELYSRIEGGGAPLLIIHGFLGMSDNWKTLGSQFAELGYQVHMLDMRNHGKSPHSEEFSYQMMVQDIVDYCQQHNLQKVNLLGHSMGGKIVMFFATQFPEMVEKLIVADIGPKYYAPHHQKILAGLTAVDFSLQPSRSEVEATLSQYISDFGTKQFLLKNLYWETPGQLAFRFNLDVFNRKIETIGEALSFEATFLNPTLFLRGDKSDYILDSDFETLYHHFPEAEIVTVRNAGHWLHAENPKDFFDYVANYLKN
ncbi:alpha/beta fold hydrolase [Flavobacterium sp.]|uniref:alpha/beta fold hydrolase n=1 Tax=Flavobacterium sp. TaxID=239 RepID=UPI0028BDA906|nr:alpha/beta fold hydrolase [Flavobacterium sp.]